jgi:hypothetical protein
VAAQLLPSSLGQAACRTCSPSDLAKSEHLPDSQRRPPVPELTENLEVPENEGWAFERMSVLSALVQIILCSQVLAC